MNTLPKVVAQQRRGRASNPRLLDRKSDALPLSHRATPWVRVRVRIMVGLGLGLAGLELALALALGFRCSGNSFYMA